MRFLLDLETFSELADVAVTVRHHSIRRRGGDYLRA
jgi:hypothetical protein